MKSKTIFTLAFLAFAGVQKLQPQNAQSAARIYQINGTIVNSETGQAPELGNIAIPEIQKKVPVGNDGSFAVSLPQGTYTFVINSPGMKTLTDKIEVNGDLTRNYRLEPATIRTGGLTIEGERDVQKVSRYTMAREELKSVPATFGDALGAVSTMAGIEREGIDYLAIRGMGSDNHRYYIDGIPVLKPQHYTGYHSIINNEMIREMDIFSSAFPVNYGSPIGAVIRFNTVDEVREKTIYTDIGLLSLNATAMAPIRVQKNGETKNAGYWIVAGRYGYISLFAPTLVKALTGDILDAEISYYDYQVKGKYYLNKDHSLTLLFFGGEDDVFFQYNPDNKLAIEQINDGVDPFVLGATVDYQRQFHTQALAHTFMPSTLLKNKVQFYSSLNEIRNYQNVEAPEAADWAKDQLVSASPNVLGVKDDFHFQSSSGIYGLSAGVELADYFFSASGKSYVAKKPPSHSGNADLSDPDLFGIVHVDQDGRNMALGGYLDNQLQLGGWKAGLGIRTDYLVEQDQQVFDPRGKLSYTFSDRGETTVAVAGGKYSSFFQTNYYYFERNPEIFELPLKPEEALHRSVSFERRIKSLYGVRIEGYYNTFQNMVEFVGSPDLVADNLGERVAYGIEATLKKDRITGRRDVYGWINYTYAESQHKSNNPNYIEGSKWIPGKFDRRHSLKAVAGYLWGDNELGCRFLYRSSYPSTPIIGDNGGTGYQFDGQSLVRYAPQYGELNSQFPEPRHQLDLRYSRKSNHSWGHLRWYVEILNIYNFRPDDTANWAYNKPYQAGQNPAIGGGSGIALLPNFGVEARF